MRLLVLDWCWRLTGSESVRWTNSCRLRGVGNAMPGVQPIPGLWPFVGMSAIACPAYAFTLLLRIRHPSQK